MLFRSKHLFNDIPVAKGAISGQPGNRVWVVWTHRYYSQPTVKSADSENVLYILRVVIEDDEAATGPFPGSDIAYEERIASLQGVLKAAQVEAAEWKLNVVKVWDPTPLLLDALSRGGEKYHIVEREDESIASALWYDRNGNIAKDSPVWLNNEHYAWC